MLIARTFIADKSVSGDLKMKYDFLKGLLYSENRLHLEIIKTQAGPDRGRGNLIAGVINKVINY